MGCQIIIDQPYVRAGSVLTGKIVLPPGAGTAKSAIENLKAVFEGVEETQITHTSSSTDSDGDSHSHRTVVRDKSPLFSQVIIEKTYAKGESIREKTVPFQFQLPVDLKSSVQLGQRDTRFHFLFTTFQADYAALYYKVKLTIQRPGLLKRNLTFEQEVQVLKAKEMKMIGTPWESVPQVDTKQRKGVLRRDRTGQIYVAASLPGGQHVQVGENLPVNVSIINDSRAAIEHVEVSLVEYSNWKAKRHWKNQDEIVVHKPVGAFGEAVMNPAKESAPGERSKYESNMWKELKSGAHHQELTIPVSCKENFSANLMNVHHTLLIKVKTGKWFGHPEVKVPIIVHSDPDAGPAPPSPSSFAAPFSSAMATPVGSPPTAQPGVSASAPTVHTQQQQETPEFPPFIQAQVGSAQVWQGANQPQATGFTAFAAKLALRGMGVDPRLLNAPPPSSSNATPVQTIPAAPPGPTVIGVPVQGYHSTPVVVNVVPVNGSAPSIPALVSQISVSPDPVQAVNQLLQISPAWTHAMASLSPPDFGKLVASVPQDFQQSPLAERLAPLVRPFTCMHLVEALRNAKGQDANRGVRNRMLTTLPRYCADIQMNKMRIRAELDKNEYMFFDAGLRNC